jgi:hypothetical protein
VLCSDGPNIFNIKISISTNIDQIKTKLQNYNIKWSVSSSTYHSCLMLAMTNENVPNTWYDCTAYITLARGHCQHGLIMILSYSKILCLFVKVLSFSSCNNLTLEFIGPRFHVAVLVFYSFTLLLITVIRFRLDA